MKPIDLFRRLPLRAPDGGEGGAGDPPADPATGAAPADPGDAPSWWAGCGEDAQGFVKAKGLDARKPDEALAALTDIARNAEKRLGRPADSLLTRPKEGQDVAEWLAEQRTTLGLPADVKGYEVKPPKDFPAEAWDTELAASAAEVAHRLGVPKSAHEAYVGLFADYVRKIDGQAAEQLETARSAMMADLEKTWGDATDTRIAAAQLAAQNLAEEAGLDSEAIQAMVGVLAPKTGDAGVLRMFDALARAMGEDSAVGLGKGGSEGGAADATAQLEALRAPGGAYYEAVKSGNQAEVKRLQPEVDRLTAAMVGKRGQ